MHFILLLYSSHWRFRSLYFFNKLQGLYPGYIIFFVQSALMIAGSRGIDHIPPPHIKIYFIPYCLDVLTPNKIGNAG